jgi:hypothetical protein
MKKLLSIIAVILLCYAIYYDLEVGTLPHTIIKEAEATGKVESVNSTIPFFEVEIKPGETVLSIVERDLKNPLSVSISDLIQDFQLLNPGQKPEEIQIGKTYKFPDYSNE